MQSEVSTGGRCSAEICMHSQSMAHSAVASIFRAHEKTVIKHGQLCSGFHVQGMESAPLNVSGWRITLTLLRHVAHWAMAEKRAEPIKSNRKSR